MAGLRGTQTIWDVNEEPVPEADQYRQQSEPLSPVDAEYRSYTKEGNLNPGNPRHEGFINNIVGQIRAGLVSQGSVENLARLNRNAAPILKGAYSEYLASQAQSNRDRSLIGKYVHPGQEAMPQVGMESGDYSAAPSIDYRPGQEAIPSRRNYQGAVDALASRGQVELAEKYQKLGGLDKGQGRGEYYVPIQTAKGIFSFNARTGQLTDSGGNVVGSASDPSLQGQLAASKEYGKEVGKESADVGRTVDASTSINDALGMLKKGIYSGTYAEAQKFAAKAVPGSDKTKAANTEEFISHIGNVVIPRLKDFGGNDTVEEMNYLKKIQGGDITMEPKALERILITADRKIKARQIRLKNQAKSVGLGGKVDTSLSEENVPVKPSFTDEEYAARRRKVLGR